MAIIYNWTITQCNRLTSDNFITTAHWICTAVDEDYAASIYSTCSWNSGNLTIPYDQVTQQEVLNWCWNSNVNKEETEIALAKNIELQKNPITVTGIPW